MYHKKSKIRCAILYVANYDNNDIYLQIFNKKILIILNKKFNSFFDLFIFIYLFYYLSS